MIDLQQLIDQTPPKGIVDLPRGEHVGNLILTKPVMLRGGDDPSQYLLDGGGERPVITIAPTVEVKVVGVTLRNGYGRVGGGIDASAAGRLLVRGCVIQECRAPLQGGGGLFIAAGQAKLQNCILTRNVAKGGGALLVSGDARVSIEGCLFAANVAERGGAVRLEEVAHVDATNCTFADNATVGDKSQGDIIHVGGTTTYGPEAVLANCILAAAHPTRAIANASALAGELSLAYSVLPAQVPATAYRDRGNNIESDPGFRDDTVNLTAESPARGLADIRRIAKEAADLWGNPRVVDGQADAGAYVFSA